MNLRRLDWKTYWFVFTAAVLNPRAVVCIVRTLWYFYRNADDGPAQKDWFTARGLAVILPWRWTEAIYTDPWTKNEMGPTRMERVVTFYFRMLRPEIHPHQLYEMHFDTFVGPVYTFRDPLLMREGEKFPTLP